MFESNTIKFVGGALVGILGIAAAALASSWQEYSEANGKAARVSNWWDSLGGDSDLSEESSLGEESNLGEERSSSIFSQEQVS